MSALKHELIVRLERIPGVSHIPYPDRHDGFSGLGFRGKEIGHFHHFHELDLRLGKKLIKQQSLKHPPDSKVHPGRSANSQYVELRFHHHQDLDEVIRLVELLVADLTK